MPLRDKEIQLLLLVVVGDCPGPVLGGHWAVLRRPRGATGWTLTCTWKPVKHVFILLNTLFKPRYFTFSEERKINLDFFENFFPDDFKIQNISRNLWYCLTRNGLLHWSTVKRWWLSLEVEFKTQFWCSVKNSLAIKLCLHCIWLPRVKYNGGFCRCWGTIYIHLHSLGLCLFSWHNYEVTS